MTEPSGLATPAPHGFWRNIVLAWLAVCAILIVRTWSAIHSFQLADPDDALRLVQVRDLLAGQGWFDLHQYRIDPPAGVATHWSRLVDTPLALTILLLRPVLGQGGAELVAAVVVPLLTLLCAMLLTARLTLKLYGARAAYASCLVWMMAIAALAQLQPMRIDHHGWQIVAVLAALNGALSSSARRGGWIIGAALGLGMSISLELLPFTALFAGVLGLRWLRDPAQREWLVQMLGALALSSAASYLVTRGLVADSHCDTISPHHLVGLGLAALLVAGIAALRSVAKPVLVLLLGAAAALVGAIYLTLSPQCLAGPFAALKPLVRHVWYNNVLEGMPVWRQDFPTMVQMIIPPLAGLLIVLMSYLRAGPDTAADRRALLGDLALLLGGAVAIAMLVSRFSAVAAAIATVPLGLAISEWLRRADTMRLTERLVVLPLIMLTLLPGFAAEQLKNRLASPTSTDRQGPAPELGRGCSLPESLPALSHLAPATIFAPFEISPTLLLETQHKVIATGHHRAAASMDDVITAFLHPPAQAEAIVRRHGAAYVLACSDLIEARNYKAFAPTGLMAQLLAGRTPSWLEPVALGPSAGNLRLYRVKPKA